MADNNCTCAHCMGVIIPRINKTTGLPSKAARKFCSSACSESHHAKGRDRNKYVRRPHRPKPVECEHCNKTVFRRVIGGKKDAGRFCGRECAFAWLAARKAARDAEILRTLAIQRTVRQEAQALRCIAAYVEKPKTFRLACIHCSTVMIVRRSIGLHKQVCDPCIKAKDRDLRRIARAKQRAEGRRSNTHRKRARKYGGEYDASVSAVRVFERDGWRCAMCGAKTPKMLKGTIDPRAPELDHIVPLSLGGGHTWANVQCSCRACNGAKGAIAKGQISLGFAA